MRQEAAKVDLKQSLSIQTPPDDCRAETYAALKVSISYEEYMAEFL